MQSQEIVAAGDLAGEGFGGLTTRAQELHSAIADRAFGLVRRTAGPAEMPIRAAHDAISYGVYGVVRAAGAAVSQVAGRAMALRASGDAPAFADSARGGLLVGTLNGFLGDRLAEREDGLSVGMTIRTRGRAVTPDRDGLAAAYPAASPRVVVFLHGLCETEGSWRLGGRIDYGERLREDLGYTPVFVRYNTGLRISANGVSLDALLSDIVDGWPVGIQEMVLVGHSMGALVVRSACHAGIDSPWPALVTHTVSLGAPHLGAPLERRVNSASRILRRFPEGRPLSSFLELRSVGIRDLRHGALVEDDWRACEPDQVHDACTDVPLLDGARHCAISATISREHSDLRGRLLGDLLVWHDSATGAGKRRKVAFEVDDLRHVGGITHFHLLNNEAVYEHLRDWLS